MSPLSPQALNRQEEGSHPPASPGDARAAYASGMPTSPRRARPTGAEENAGAALYGGGPSQLGIGGSMRARDVSRPREEDLAEAERLVQVSYRPRSRPTS